MKLLVEDATYVLLRRFSAKEEKRRLVAAPLIRGFAERECGGTGKPSQLHSRSIERVG